LIVFIFPSGTFGGHEKMALIMVKSLINELNIPVECIVSNENDRLVVELKSIGANFTTHAFPSSKLDLIFGYLNFRLLSAFLWACFNVKSQAHVILVNGNAVANHRITLALAAYCRIVGQRCSMYIPMIHNSDELELSLLKGFFYRISIKRALQSVTDLWTIDKVWADRISSINKLLKTYVIQNLVPPIYLPTPSQVKPSATIDICFVGRLEKRQKGLDFLVSILSKLNSTKLVMIHIVGDGPDSLWLRKQVDQIKDAPDANIKFVFHGWVSNPQQIMASCSALILPSRVEGIPLVVIEALMLQLEVFSFGIPGLTTFSESVHLATPFYVDEFANMLNIFIADPVCPKKQKKILDTLSNEERFYNELVSAING